MDTATRIVILDACSASSFIPVVTDCDDNDPQRNRESYPDGDGDGIGTGAPACNVEPPPAGFAASTGDCDDANPLLDWAAGLNDCPCERFLGESEVTLDPECPTAAKLVVADSEVCLAENCGEALTFRVGNAGGLPAEGPIDVLVTFGAEEVTVQLETLDSGRMSSWLRVPFTLGASSGTASVSFPTASGDCGSSTPVFEAYLQAPCTQP